MASTASIIEVVGTSGSSDGASLASSSVSTGSFGAFLSALVNATDAISDFYSNYMIAQAAISEDQSTSGVATSTAEVTETNKEIEKMDKYEEKLHKSSFLSKLTKGLAIAASVLVVCALSATGVGALGGVALALAVFSLIMTCLPSADNPLMMAGNQLGKAFGDKSAGKWIGLGLQIGIGFASLGAGVASGVANSTRLMALVGEDVAPTAINAARGTALVLDVGATGTSMAGASYTLEAADIMKNSIAPLKGDIASLTAFAGLLSTLVTQESDSETSMKGSFTTLFTAQDTLAETYGDAYEAGV